MLRVTINGRQHEFSEPMTILKALESISLEVPALCDDPRLKPVGACRLCVVELKGEPRPVTACNTMLTDGMQIETHSSTVEQLRRTNFALLAHQYPPDAIAKVPEKPLHRWLKAYDVANKATGASNPQLFDDSHPYIQVDMSRCIYCYRCVRICDELQGQFVWQVWNRGDRTRILPDSGTTLLESSCVSCGACVDSCPSGALEDRKVVTVGMATKWTKTTCPYCGVGCEMLVGTRGNEVTLVKPVINAPVSKGHLCVKGRYAFDFVRSRERITEPMIRRDGHFEKVSWKEAVEFVATNFRRILGQHGPKSIGVLGSARATNEENYLTQKFARVVLGTNNVDCCARVCHAPSAAAMKKVMGTGAATSSFDDIEKAKTILLCGSNATENHPIVGARIKQARLNNTNLIVVDPREIELARYANIHLQLRLGTNVPLFNAMACAIIEERLFDEATLMERVSGWETFREFVRGYTPERVASICNVNAKLIRKASWLYATAKPSICFHGLGMTEHVQGTEGVMCLINLALITGNVGKAGTGINPLRGQNNVQGSAHMGCEPGNLTGFVPIQQGRETFERIWQSPIPSEAGMNLMQMMDAATEQKLKALWAIGYDVALTNPDAADTKKALDSLEFLVVQDMFMTEIAEFADVFLPVASSFEKDGTFMNSERRIQRVRKILDPPENCKADWEIVCEIARTMGGGRFFDFHSPKDIWNEIRSVWKVGQGITYERIEEHGLQWPCPNENHPGTAALHSETFPTGKQAPLQEIEYHPTKESVTEEFPYLLTTGRTLYQFNAGTMTMHTQNRVLRPTDLLDISPDDAELLGLHSGDTVGIRSRYGRAVLPVQVNPAIKHGELFATFHTRDGFVNRVTNPLRDNYVDTPEYKVTAVRLEKLA